jgi:hypothetical protein
MIVDLINSSSKKNSIISSMSPVKSAQCAGKPGAADSSGKFVSTITFLTILQERFSKTKT